MTKKAHFDQNETHCIVIEFSGSISQESYENLSVISSSDDECFTHEQNKIFIHPLHVIRSQESKGTKRNWENRRD